MTRVSIIIPVYNVEEYIESCLMSVLDQSCQDIEIILVDDCGTDNSITIASDIIEKHPNGNKVKIISHKKNRGLSAARNTGIENSSGDYVYFLDSDDEISLYMVEIMLQQVDKYQKPDFIIGGYCLLDKHISSPQLQLNDGLIEGNNKILNSFVKHEWYMMAWNKLVNRKFLLKKGLFFEEGLLHEDNIWSFMLACTAEKMCVVNEITYKYRIRENSIMHDKSEILALHYFKNIDLAVKFICENGYFNAISYKYIEYIKRAGFKRAVQLKYSVIEKKKIYKIFRGYKKQFYPIKLSLKEGIRDFHYKLSFGFYIYLNYINVAVLKDKILMYLRNTIKNKN